MTWPVAFLPCLMIVRSRSLRAMNGTSERDRQQPHRRDRQQRDEMVALGEEHRDGHDREQLAHRPGSENVPAEVAAEHAVVVQDRCSVPSAVVVSASATGT